MELMFNDAETEQSTGIFLIGELERLDPRLYMPVTSYTWQRDIPLRSDVTYATDSTSFMKMYFGAAKDNDQQINFQNGNSNVTANTSIELDKTLHPFRPWSMKLMYTFRELQQSQLVNRPIDVQKHFALEQKYQQDIERITYVGTTIGNTVIRGLLNQVEAEKNIVTIKGKWADPTTSPDSIVQDINSILTTAYAKTKFTIVPRKMLLDPALLSILATRKVSDAGNVSILKYVLENSLTKLITGVELDIQPLKWLTSAPGFPGAIPNRIVVYVPEEQYVRFPLFPIRRYPTMYAIDMVFNVTYYAGLGELENVYPETITYAQYIA